MKPREMFGLVNRIIGLIVALYGIDWLARFVLGQLGYFKLERTDIAYYLVMAIGYLSIGLYFLSGASHFVRYAYGDDEDEERIDDDVSYAEQYDDTHEIPPTEK